MVKTASDKWKNTILKYKKQCQTIIQISSNIRYAGVINNYGRTLTGVIKPTLKPILKSEEVKRFSDSPPDVEDGDYEGILVLNKQIKKNEGLRRGQIQEISS